MLKGCIISHSLCFVVLQSNASIDIWEFDYLCMM
jgi:hypothetical protein